MPPTALTPRPRPENPRSDRLVSDRVSLVKSWSSRHENLCKGSLTFAFAPLAASGTPFQFRIRARTGRARRSPAENRSRHTDTDDPTRTGASQGVGGFGEGAPGRDHIVHEPDVGRDPDPGAKCSSDVSLALLPGEPRLARRVADPIQGHRVDANSPVPGQDPS